MNKLPFDCGRPNCDGEVSIVTGPGRRHEFFTGLFLSVPEDFPTASCDKCGELYLTSGEAEQLECVLRERNIVRVVRCSECVHGEPGELADDSPGVICGVSFLHSSQSVGMKYWPVWPLDHYCAKGERRQCSPTSPNPT